LTIIDWALQTINKKRAAAGEAPLDITQIPRDDKASYDLLTKSQTTAVFQLESRGMKELIRKLRPDCFDDIIALVALFRPGPLESGMVDDYINVKHGAKAEYAHPALVPILKPTNGVILYQEQVMQIARELAGYTLGGADMLRRAMGKKKPEEMAKEREKFTTGAVANHIEESIATYTFDLMEKFAGYGFNKSHSAAYALVAYQTAWLKTHYQAAFMAAVLSSDMDNTDKVVILIEECRQMKIKICPPDINVSYFKFAVDEIPELGEEVILYGIGAMKGVGENAIDDVIRERETQGAFKDLVDFCKRVDLRKVNRRVLEALIKAGAFDRINDNRAALLDELPTALKIAEQHGKTAQTGQNDLFGLEVREASDAQQDTPDAPPSVEPWSDIERLNAEKLVLGLYLTGHPIDQYAAELKFITNGSIAALIADAERSKSKQSARIVGLVVEMRTRQTKSGKNMGFATLDDSTGRLEVAAFGDTYDKYRDILSKDSLIVAEGSVSVDDFSNTLRLTAEKIYSFEQARAGFARAIVLNWPDGASNVEFTKRLGEILQPYQNGNCPMQLHYKTSIAKASLQLGDQWRVHPQDELLIRLRRWLGKAAVEIRYR
ncbi:MAG: DNA polymerase III subunit alpha, partial [Methylococcaceae bacterium]|nr:DNA polymerase III subunit alpha [Methylococcaceae bacterium]